MKKLLGLLACLGMMIVLPCCEPSPAEWKLVWEDNFDQADSFDPVSWSKIPGVHPIGIIICPTLIPVMRCVTVSWYCGDWLIIACRPILHRM